MTESEYKDKLINNIKILNETIWDGSIKLPKIKKWLSNFELPKDELNALFLLSKFMYFGKQQIRELLVALYRDLYKYPIIKEIRKNNANTIDSSILESEFIKIRNLTYFMALGNVSESATHLLYFLRQENGLPKTLFPNGGELFVVSKEQKLVLKYPHKLHYVFFDDFCGTGTQAIEYTKDIVSHLKYLNPDITCKYLMLFATAEGKKKIIDEGAFDFVDAVVTIDKTFKLFDAEARFYTDNDKLINRDGLYEFCGKYGKLLMSGLLTKNGLLEEAKIDLIAEDNKLGFSDCQLLLGFYHNVPDNTLPIIWYNEGTPVWYPIFKRYNKIYGE